jgi:chloride channel protein, CIC family
MSAAMGVTQEPDFGPRSFREHRSLFVLASLAFAVGGTSGLLGALFRLVLERSDRFRSAIIDWAHGKEIAGFALVIGISAIATGLAAWLVRKFAPGAKGSGIPDVEAVLRDEQPPPSLILIPVKFLGGVLAMGAGLALGREGPTVQMGAGIGHFIATAFRRNQDDVKALLAAGAGAGLATAFSAPLAGAVFVLEELVRRFDTRITVTTLCASGSAIAVARLLLGNGPDFRLEPLPYSGFATVPIFLVLGALTGLMGVAYNHVLLGALAAAERLGRWLSAEVRAATVGAAVGLLAWFGPGLVGGGDAITQHTLAGGESVMIVSAVFLVRFGLGPVSYTAGTPGGLFAPMLVLGAQSGLVLGTLFCRWSPYLAERPEAFAVVGMAPFFTAVVRAPVTGIILVTEMTGCFTLLLPMLLACFAAMTVAILLGDPPIYDSLSRLGSAARHSPGFQPRDPNRPDVAP